MTQLTLLVLIDAFRRDYLERTEAIQRLASHSGVGALRPDLGFVPRAAYFGGLTPAEYGFTNRFCCDPAASPFAASDSSGSRLGRAADDGSDLRQRIEQEARSRVSPYAASYLSTYEIPIDLLPQFDLVEKRAPWDPAVGYRSVFHDLEDRGDAYVTVAWPETKALPDSSDAGIVEQAMSRIVPGVRFAYVHLQELDAVGHAHGSESPELAACLARTDALVESLVSAMQSRFDQVDVVLFGDHGMVSVTRTTDVWKALQKVGLRLGRDLVGFLDATMARFWFPASDLRAEVTAALAPLPGRVLTADDFDRYGLTGCDRRNGELIFLADPGVFILPNFFQRHGAPPRGMHGYDPDCPDNQGLFLVHSHGQTTARDLGIVGATTVYRAVRQSLDLAAADLDETRTLIASEAPVSDGIFTQHPDPAADTLIATHLAQILEEIRTLAPTVETVLLTGSYGRGEGAVRRGDRGQFVPASGYAFLVIAPNSPDGRAPEWKAAAHRLREELGADFVHFTVWQSLSPAFAPTLASYDLRHGSRILIGRPDTVALLPPMTAGEIPAFEAVQLLFNRLGGLLTGLGAGARGPRAEWNLVDQTMRALMALGDWHLLRAQAYDTSYRKRHERFTWLAPGLQLPDGQAEAISTAYQFKLYPDSVRLTDAMELACTTTEWLVAATIRSMGDITGETIATPEEAALAYYELTTADPAFVAHDNASTLRALDGDAVVQVQASTSASVRQTIYSAIPLVAAGMIGDDSSFRTAATRLSACLTPPWPSELTPANWELVRSRLAHAWLSLVH